ncbi:MAG: TldD/PmbA family protein [Elusimicrobia bacterium]|nr:TldD/PmbA family protein [Elusimicrobiota bacterium]
MKQEQLKEEAISLDLFAAEALDWIRGQEKDLEAEIFLAKGVERTAELKENKPFLVHQAQECGVGLRLFRQGRRAFSYAEELSLPAFQHLFEKVRCYLPHAAYDPYHHLPKSPPGSVRANAPLPMDPQLLRRPISELWDQLQTQAQAALSQDRRVKKVLRLALSESLGESYIANSQGLKAQELGSFVSAGISLVAEVNSEIQTGSAYSLKRFSEDLSLPDLRTQAVERAVSLLNGKKIPSRRRAVLFDPWAASEFLSELSAMLCADQILKGKSLLANRLKTRVASPHVHLTDDPGLPRGYASSLYDGEGLPTQKRHLIQNGILQDYLHDTYTATRMGQERPGSASRNSFRSLPHPAPSNFVLEPGPKKRQELIRDTSEGILLQEVMGMHTADPISGEFSVAASGLHIQNGELRQALQGAMLSGNFLELLKNVDAVAEDLTFYGGWGSPTFRVQDLMVA